MQLPQSNRGVVFVFGSLGLGGAERQALYLAQYLQRRFDPPLHVYGLYGQGGKLADECDRLGIPWRALGLRPPSNIIRPATQSRILGQMLSVDRPAVVLPYANHANVYCGLTWRCSGARICMWSQHDTGLHRLPTLYERRAAGSVSRFVAVSRAAGRFLIDQLGISPQQLSIIPNAVQLAAPVASRHEWRQRLGIAQDGLVVIMVSNMTPSKDHSTLLQAWRVVHHTLASLDKEALLLLAGRSCGDSQERLTKLCRALGISEHVRFLGFEDDVSGLLKASDVAVHSSNTEGFCVAILEAMAAGLPVVGTDIPGVREVLGPENRSWMCPPNSPGRFAQLVLAFCENGNLRDRVGAANLSRAESQFSVDRMCERTSSLFASALT
ncbi:MAG: glycosyltransferase [Armatimonadetes bacterium]|nr:glycosyltransferase [Armatimonadota bacterium]